MPHFSLALILATLLLSIVLAHRIARKKGRNPVFWGLMAGMFGPFILPVLLLMKPKSGDHDQPRV